MTATRPNPPKPPSRPERVTLWRYLKLFRQDLLSAQPEKLYRAWMAEFKTPFFRSYLANDPSLVKEVLKTHPDDFPKSARVTAGLRPLLGNSVFVTNGETWKRQRRIIDPAFEGGRVREIFPAMYAAGLAAVARLEAQDLDAPVEIEFEASHAAADVIFRTLFSIPIENQIASQVFSQFRKHQRSQPIVNLAAFVPLPNWFPRFFRKDTRETAQSIRDLITTLTKERLEAVQAGTAPDDLATKIMTTADPLTGDTFDVEEMVDQVAIFFLAGHETSASALSWALYLLALYPEWQDEVAREADEHLTENFSCISRLKITRDVFRETLRLYPPVPMMVREAAKTTRFRDRVVKAGAQVVLSPWHLQRHTRLWNDPDAFDPSRFQTENGKSCLRNAYIPFSEGPRACVGAGFAMIEGALLIAMLVRAFHFEIVEGKTPMPEAHLTVRAKDGIWLRIRPRA